MGLWHNSKGRSAAAEEREASVVASLGSHENRRVEVFDDRVEVNARHRFVVASKDLAKAEGRAGWKVMPYGTGVAAEVIAGNPGSAATRRPTVTRMVGRGEFSPAKPRRTKGGSKPTAVLAIANEAGQFFGITFDAANVSAAMMLEDVLNHRAGAYRQPGLE